MTMHVHRDPTVVPTDPRMRAYWKFHGDGAHKVPREGVRPDHFYCCSWCDATQSHWSMKPGTRRELGGGTYTGEYIRVYDDREVEKFILPQRAASDPMAAVMGRLG